MVLTGPQHSDSDDKLSKFCKWSGLCVNGNVILPFSFKAASRRYNAMSVHDLKLAKLYKIEKELNLVAGPQFAYATVADGCIRYCPRLSAFNNFNCQNFRSCAGLRLIFRFFVLRTQFCIKSCVESDGGKKRNLAHALRSLRGTYILVHAQGAG